MSTTTVADVATLPARARRASNTRAERPATEPQPVNPFGDAPIIHRYTRTEAIEDGVLFDVTETAEEAGFKVPTAITETVHEQCVRWTEDDSSRKPHVHQDEDGRLWDVLWMASCRAREIARRGIKTSTALFQVIVVPRPGNGHQRLHTLKLVIGPGDAGEAVATIMLPDES